MDRLVSILDKLADDDVEFSNIGTLAAGAIGGGYSHSTVTVAGDGSFHEMDSFKLPLGVYIIKVAARFQTNPTGTRAVNISSTSAGSADVVWDTAKQNAASTNYTYVHLITFKRVTANDVAQDGYKTFYVNGSQSSGSNLTVAPRVGVICLRNEYATTKPSSGSGGGGTADYTQLQNLPSISDTTLIGDLSLEDIGVIALTNAEIDTLLED